MKVPTPRVMNGPKLDAYTGEGSSTSDTDLSVCLVVCVLTDETMLRLTSFTSDPVVPLLVCLQG